MSVNITYTKPSNTSQWITIKNGTFAILEGNEFHPIPKGLYRIFTMPVEDGNTWMIVPIFEDDFAPGMFPYMISHDHPEFPELKTIVNKINIEIEI